MYTLILNAGSSSLRFALFDKKLRQLYKGHVDAIGQRHCKFRRYLDNGLERKKRLKAKNHKDAIAFALKKLQKDKIIKDLTEIKKVGHRVVHGGEEFTKPTKLTALTIRKLEKLNRLAPLHNPANLEAVEAAKKLLGKSIHFAIFDTAFHATLPEKAFLYGLPYKFAKQGIRRYGFHGTSHEYVSKEAAKILNKKSAAIITCHMGNGISLAAIKNGKCLDTSMGFTPLEGPIMGTRSGSIDPAIIFHLTGKLGKKLNAKSLNRIHEMLEYESGFKGLSGISSDIRKLWAKPKAPGTKRTFKVLSYQMAKLITGYFTTLGGLPDAIVFTAGIGENAHYLRKQICDYLKPFGILVDQKRNRGNETLISVARSKTKIFIIKTQEELQMAKVISETA